MLIFIMVLLSCEQEISGPNIKFQEIENRTLCQTLKFIKAKGTNIDAWSSEQLDSNFLKLEVSVEKFPFRLTNGELAYYILGNIDGFGLIFFAHYSPQKGLTIEKLFKINTHLIRAKSFGKKGGCFLLEHYAPAGTGIPTDLASVWFDNNGKTTLIWEGLSSFGILESNFRFDFVLKDFYFVDGGKVKAKYLVQIMESNIEKAVILLTERYFITVDIDQLNCCDLTDFKTVIEFNLCFDSLVRGEIPASITSFLINNRCTQ